MTSKPAQIPVLTVRALTAVGVEVPMTYALGTSRGRIAKAPLLLIDLVTEEGVTGRAYLWSYFRQAMPAIASILAAVEERTKGERVVPGELWSKLAERFALIGVQGIVRMAMAGFDVACWDALAVAAGMPLARMVGAEPRPIPAYNSCGLGLIPRHQTAARLSDVAGRSCGGPRGEEAHPGRHRADGRLQPGAHRG
jgi:mandelate racemase